ncbi:MAG: LLM class flavin-dependent oxidoreductase [Ilumatobacteraceae bacterium]
MQYGFVVPWADVTDIGTLAEAAEEHGWDGLFVWEPVWGVDAWVSLAVAACHTSTIRLGTMLTPLPRRKPWELAGQVATVDRLSGGRVVLTVGLGAPEAGFEAFGEVTDRRERAERLDEGLAVLRGLWKGQPFQHDGTHYRIAPCDFPSIGHTVQQPGVPIWCVGALGSSRSMQRALSCDGLLPQALHDGKAEQCTLDELRDIELPTTRADGRPFDVVIEGAWTEHAPATWGAAGATWWIESMWAAMSEADPVASALDRLRAGPPG